MLLFLGIVFLPLTKKVFGGFFLDFGYPFSKTLATLILSYSIFVLATFKILAFTQYNLFLLISLFTFLNYFILKRSSWQTSKKEGLRKSLSMIALEEILFFISFFFWVYVRGQEPSIRGLEKFMDFGFINSILRAKYFPPLDMWLSADATHPAGYPINYYYFGHLTGATLIKFINIKPAIGYNLILATIFALGVTQVFSLVFNLVFNYLKKVKNYVFDNFSLFKIVLLSLLGTLIVNLGGNLHTIYLFTSGYPTDNPIPFWKILGGLNSSKYWYPNATRFIPYTIHEFPSYSYVVADLHGHVFDIPFVLLTLAVLLTIFLSAQNQNPKLKNKGLNTKYLILYTIFLGFLIAVHYMTNAFDGPIYILLSLILFLVLLRFSFRFFLSGAILLFSFIIFSFPFSKNFSPFITGIGVNCSPNFLTNIGKIGPFLFEKGNCQVSPLWMLFILWGFFWISFILFIAINYLKNKATTSLIEIFIFFLFCYGTFLVIIPEFFYIKDIYPVHFRANTMFKLGYQAFIMMGIASIFTFFQTKIVNNFAAILFRIIFIFFSFFVLIYPFCSIPSYYGLLKRPVELDGSLWLENNYPQDKEIIDYLNEKITGQPVVLEAQGDSYTDFERVSAYTGLPTVAGWWVHEWLWRGSSDVVGKKIPDITNLYESHDVSLTKKLIDKYHIGYIIVSQMERQKYPRLYENKFSEIGRKVFKSSSGLGALYQVNFKRY